MMGGGIKLFSFGTYENSSVCVLEVSSMVK